MWCAARARVYRECWLFGQTRAQAAGTSVSSNAWPDGRFISRGDTRIKLYTLATMFPRGFGALEFSSIDHTMHASNDRKATQVATVPKPHVWLQLFREEKRQDRGVHGVLP